MNDKNQNPKNQNGYVGKDGKTYDDIFSRRAADKEFERKNQERKEKKDKQK